MKIGGSSKVTTVHADTREQIAAMKEELLTDYETTLANWGFPGNLALTQEEGHDEFLQMVACGKDLDDLLAPADVRPLQRGEKENALRLLEALREASLSFIAKHTDSYQPYRLPPLLMQSFELMLGHASALSVLLRTSA